jgi:hypothetical protein
MLGRRNARSSGTRLDRQRRVFGMRSLSAHTVGADSGSVNKVVMLRILVWQCRELSVSSAYSMSHWSSNGPLLPGPSLHSLLDPCCRIDRASGAGSQAKTCPSGVRPKCLSRFPRPCQTSLAAIAAPTRSPNTPQKRMRRSWTGRPSSSLGRRNRIMSEN